MKNKHTNVAGIVTVMYVNSCKQLWLSNEIKMLVPTFTQSQSCCPDFRLYLSWY